MVHDPSKNFKPSGQHVRADNPDREKDDFYPTPPAFTAALLDRVQFDPYVWEPTSGKGDISEVVKHYGYNCHETDLNPRTTGGYTFNFLEHGSEYGFPYPSYKFDIIMNPPFKHLLQFLQLAHERAEKRMACVLPLAALCGKRRYEGFFGQHPPRYILMNYVFLKIEGTDGKEDIPSQFYHLWAVWDKAWEHPGRASSFEYIQPPVRGYMDPV